MTEQTPQQGTDVVDTDRSSGSRPSLPTALDRQRTKVVWSTRRSLFLIAGGAGVMIVLVLLVMRWRSEQSADPSTTAFANTVQSGDLRVTMQIDQATVGSRLIDVLVRDAAGQPVELSGMRLRFSMAEMDMSDIEVAAERVRTDLFRAQGQFFTMAGRWSVTATLLRDGQPPLLVPFELAIAAPGEVSGALNPLTADEGTLAAGRLLYQTNCVVCHGTTGQGNGPSAIGLRPPPGDFTQHMQPGKHADGQIYLWIRDGYPQTAMPAWKERLNEQQLWQLVTYVRTFGAIRPERSTAAAPQPTAQPLTAPESVVPDKAEPLPPLIFTRAGNLWRSDGTGAAPRQITSLPADSYAEYPAFSPAGKQIAFIATTQAPLTETTPFPLPIPNTQLYLMRDDGSDLRMIWDPERGQLGPSVWAPDGKALYVSLADVRSPPDAPVADRLFQIVRLDPQTGARQIVLEDSYDLTISRDEQQRVFLRWHAQYAEFTLNVLAADGSGEREVIPYGVFSTITGPRLSPDGRQIIFTTATGPVTDPEGYPIATRTQSPLEQLLGFLAPDAAAAHPSLSYLWVINTDGTGLRRLVQVPFDSPVALFSPDGTQIVMMDANGIYMLNADGTNMRKIDPLGDHGGLDWAPR